jgi:hypothetical protein
MSNQDEIIIKGVRCILYTDSKMRSCVKPVDISDFYEFTRPKQETDNQNQKGKGKYEH